MAWNLKDLEKQLLIGSTLVEGSTLTESQAKLVLQGRTIQGHPIQEIRELLNYRAAVDWFMKQLQKSPFLSKDLILDFHKRLFQGFAIESGVWKSHSNYTYHLDGTRYEYLDPAKVDRAINDWIFKFNDKLISKHPVEVAANLYYQFQSIHPFEDGNGRIGRILIAYWLHWKADLSLTFKLKDKLEHLEALEKANQEEHKCLVKFFKKRSR